MNAIEAYVGEIQMFGFNFAPPGWLPCDGRLLPIQQNTALFAVIGTNYGGDGRANFALPDLRSRVPIGIGAGPGLTARVLGDQGGSPTHTLTQAEVPTHGHAWMATDTANSPTPGPSTLLANTGTAGVAYQPPGNVVAMADGLLSTTTGGQPHENRQPYLGVNYCICVEGIFPPRS